MTKHDYPRNDENGISLIYSTIKESVESQHTQRNSLETKANALSAFAGGMFALLMGTKDILFQLSRIGKNLILLSILLFFLSVILNTIVMWVRHYRYDPNPEMLAKHYLKASEQEIKFQLISNLVGSWKNNTIILERNAAFLRVSFIAQTIGFILLGIAVFTTVLGK